MDLMSTAQLLGNFGEFFGAIAVVVTLIYLAGQLRQNTRALRSAAVESFANLGSGINDFAARHADEILNVSRGSVTEFEDRLTNGAMGREDLVFANYAHRNLRLLEATYQHYREGTLADDVFKARVNGFIQVFRSQPGIGVIWKNGQNLGYADDFRDFVNENIVAASQ